MIGLSQAQTRGLLEASLDVIVRVLQTEEPVTFRNDRWDLREARPHLRPYSSPLFDVAVAAVASPTGAKLAGGTAPGCFRSAPRWRRDLAHSRCTRRA
jgi:limonene 1,2-monooxygenase